MAYISPTGTIVRTAITTGKVSPTSTSTQTSTQTQTGTTSTSIASALSGTPFTDWHKALLWFLGGVLLIALAGPAPNISTMLLLIIIVGVLLGNWNDYAKFLGLANMVTGGTTHV